MLLVTPNQIFVFHEMPLLDKCLFTRPNPTPISSNF